MVPTKKWSDVLRSLGRIASSTFVKLPSCEDDDVAENFQLEFDSDTRQIYVARIIAGAQDKRASINFSMQCSL